MATIVVTAGPCEGQSFPLDVSRLVSVGRDDQCSIQLLDEQVSRRHLQIRFDPDQDRHYAVDMRSANGVFVNGARVTEDRLLDDGDIIVIGGSELRYTSEEVDDVDLAIEQYRKKDEWKRGTSF
ncbi:MAG: FHA domain-containing protein [Planctomycetota bacterium]|jgi:pSer/pThr/pTyr-binding forkhead associated (FHA) protein